MLNMMPEIITFNKTMQYRLHEYEQLFDGVETPCSEVIEVWGSTFEDLAIIGVDWRALWILSEENCKKYNLLYPTAVIVNVDEFVWSELTANVRVLAVQEDILLPAAAEVPVIELHPIKVQNYDETDLRAIEDWLDKCRYFFNNLWYPWDAKLNVSLTDWCESHLRNRLKMQYDIKYGVFDKTIINYLKLLLVEAKNINVISEKNFSQEDDRLTLVKRYLRRKIIKTELDLFEEPDLRYGMILLKQNEKRLRSLTENSDKEIKFVWANGSYQSLMQHLENAQVMIDKNTSVKVFGSLQEALDSSCTNDIIIIPSGVHIMNALRGIENGGIIKGIDKYNSSIMPDKFTIPKAILFECFGCIELENLTISKPNGIAIQVFEGTVTLKKCKIISTENNSTSKGIVVVSGCKLILEECELQGFGTAIALQADTCASLKETNIFNSYEGIKVTENASLSLQKVVISSCSVFGIRIESTEIHSSTPLIGGLNLLESITLNCNITADSVKFSGNGKGDVAIKSKDTVLYFEEAMKADISNEVICISSDGEDSDGNNIEEIQISFNKAL